jgi:single-stranded DNA-binding protein
VNVSTFYGKAIEQTDKFIKGAGCYVEGSIKLDEWAGHDGTERHGLSCMSWHCRIAAIGQNKTPKCFNDRPKATAETQASTGTRRSNIKSRQREFVISEKQEVSDE